MDKYRKVSPKDPFAFPARLYNDLIDVSRDNKKRKGFRNVATKHETDYYIQNKTGKRLSIYSVVMITDIVNDFPDSADDDINLNFLIEMKIVFKGEIPDKTSTHFNKICILQQPLEIDEIGVGLIDGLSKCNLYLNETDIFTPTLPSFARPLDQNTDYLVIGNYGTIEVLFNQVPVKQKSVFGVVNLGGAVVSSYFLVDLVWKSGGDSDTDYEARIYDIKLNDVVIKADTDIAANDNPYRRPQDYNITKADIGLAFIGGTGDVLIAWCNEYPLIGVAEVMP